MAHLDCFSIYFFVTSGEISWNLRVPSFDLALIPPSARFSACSKSEERLWNVNEGGDSYYSGAESFQTLLWSKLGSCAWFSFVQAAN